MQNSRFLISLFSFLLIGVEFLDAVPQKIVLYKEADCSTSSGDDHFDVTEETTVIDGSGFEGAKSVLVAGVWEVILKNSANEDVRHLLHQQPDNINCTNTQDFAGTGHTFRHITRIGLAEIDTSALIVATEQQLGGERTIIRGRWSVDWPLNIKSIALFAPFRKWNVYGYADYEGAEACIASDDPTKKHFVADLERTLQVQSAKPDTSGYCPGDGIILPPPGEITSPAPTTPTVLPDPTATTVSAATTPAVTTTAVTTPSVTTSAVTSSAVTSSAVTSPVTSPSAPTQTSPATTPVSSPAPPSDSTPVSSSSTPSPISDPSADPTNPTESSPTDDPTNPSNEPPDTTTAKLGGVAVQASLFFIILLMVSSMTCANYLSNI